MQKRITVFLAFVFACFHTVASSQSANALQTPNIVSPSPNAAALGKYGDIPVSTYTGIPNVTIPLYEIKSGSITLPVTLNYHAGGIRVEEEASWIGLGWVLNSGGMFSRTIRGKDDFGAQGYLNCPKIIDVVCQAGTDVDVSCTDASQPINGFCLGSENIGAFSRDYAQYVTVDGVVRDYSSVSTGNTDWEPDVFSFNMLGYSGKFVLDRDFLANGKIHFFERQSFQVTPSFNGILNSWLVKDDNGIKYTFSAVEYVQAETRDVPATWYLTKIEDATGNTVTLAYESENTYEETQTNTQSVRYQSAVNDVTRINYHKTVYLRRIVFDQGYLLFNRGTRDDIINGRKLNGMQVYRGTEPNGVLLKEFTFGTDYYNPGGSVRDKRLRLDNVVEKGGGVEKAQRFLYDPTPLPSKNSFSRDHWGYYNGANNGNRLFPGYMGFVKDENGSSTYMNLDGADRKANEDYTKAGVLVRITYPTGGSTGFEYEGNTFDNSTGLSEDQYQWVSPGPSAFLYRLSNGQGYSYLGNATKEFAIPDDPLSQMARVVLNVADVVNRTGGASGNFIRMQILEQGSQTIMYSYAFPLANASSVNYNVIIPAGAYMLRVLFDDGNYDARASIAVQYLAKPQLNGLASTYTVGGGIRIKRISDYDGISQTKTKRFDYHYTEPNAGSVPMEYSTGKLMSKPRYSKEGRYFISANNTVQPKYYFERTASSNVSISTSASGSAVGYSKVVIYNGENGEAGKTEITYINQADVYIDYPERAAGVPTLSNLLNGKTDTQIDYTRRPDGQYLLAKSTSHSYRVDQKVRIKAALLTSEPWTYGIRGCGHIDNVHYYPMEMGWVQLIRTLERMPSQNNPLELVETLTEYEYNPLNLQVSRQVQTNSRKEQIVQRTVYPLDYGTLASTNGGIKNLQDRNVIDVPVEQYTIRQEPDGTNARVVAGTITTFQEDRPLPKEVRILEQSVPTSMATFQPSNLTPNSFAPDPRYKQRLDYRLYDNKGNLRELAKSDDMSVTYLWGYNRQYPIAEIKNATYEQVRDALGGQAAVDQLASSATLTSAQTSQVNGLRQALPRAMVTAYTYEPLVGMSSQTGPDGITVFYEYDGFQRLKTVKDRQGNVLKRYQYHYTGRPLPAE